MTTPIAISTPISSQALHTTVSVTRAGKNRRLLLVPVMINGKGPFQFILDTGAPTTVLSKRFADSEHIESQAEATGLGAAGEISASMTVLSSVQVGDAGRESLHAAIVENFDEIHRRLPSVVGALGVDFMRNYTLIIDYAHDTVTFADDVHVPANDGLPFETNDVGLYTNVKINGQGPFLFAIDTGATESVLDPVIATKLHLPVREESSLHAAGGTGIGAGRYSEFSSLQAGQYTQNGGRMFVTDIFAPLRAAMKRDVVGILGYPFFGEGSVTFDFPDSRLSIAE